MTHPPVAPVPRALQWSGWTDRGKVRPHNEDSLLALKFDAAEVHRLRHSGKDTTEKGDFAFAVSDGMGGARAGEFASRIAVEKITTLLPRAFRLGALGLAGGVDDVLTELFDRIHRALVYVGGSYEECHGMETTLSLCWFTPGWMYFGHIGDSRIYYLSARDGEMKQLTQDDTHVGWLLRNGRISEYEARHHPRRNVLQKALGGGNQFVDPQVGAVAYEPGDIFLLCTDGLVDGLYDSRILEMLRRKRSPRQRSNVAPQLVAQSIEQSGRDNTTAVTVEIL